jgi:hypothetical protein
MPPARPRHHGRGQPRTPPNLPERHLSHYVVRQWTNGAFVTRARAAEYRRLAQECLTAARSISTEEARAALIERAELWLRLAKEQDEEGTDIEGPIPSSPPQDQPVAQQQQQVQPKDDGVDDREKT